MVKFVSLQSAARCHDTPSTIRLQGDFAGRLPGNAGLSHALPFVPLLQNGSTHHQTRHCSRKLWSGGGTLFVNFCTFLCLALIVFQKFGAGVVGLLFVVDCSLNCLNGNIVDKRNK
ncbi:hypothetical protein CEXT_809131 [Caerostris extrusa]|uniref:Uncharacterized protein n=1 Tax=Caerostris extrusa TaxID=172846 RepID=A0AAV4TYU8_CAEEX|nr:hypothetical protein CEXT_809131 [Caerostris extrusa]